MGGMSLWQSHPMGYSSGLTLLFRGAMLFLGLLVFFLLQPVLAGVPFPLEDFVVILVMGMIFFHPIWFNCARCGHHYEVRVILK
jgi:hypothetical protein